MMKRNHMLIQFMFVVGCLTAFAFPANEVVLFTIDDKPVYASEFEYIYSKNNANGELAQQTVDEYLDLFINFKLKVAEAQAVGLDTTAAFLVELNNYRTQLARPYLTDTEAKEALILEAYERKQEELEIAHIAIKLPESPTVADTLAAYNRIMDIRNRLTSGKSRKKVPAFDVLAKELSDDPSAKENGGYLGWMSAFRYLYPIETAAYNTQVGDISMPVRTPFGYHIIKVLQRQPSSGERKVAHIMCFTDRNNDSINQIVLQMVDSIYQRAVDGEDFGRLVQRYSQDRSSVINNGELPWFGRGEMLPKFEDAAFALSEIGTISEPVRSAYGWHIIKLVDKRDRLSLEQMRETLQHNLERDSRYTRIHVSFVNKLKQKYSCHEYKENRKGLYLLAGRYNMVDTAFVTQAAVQQLPLFSIADSIYMIQDFVNYLIGDIRQVQQSIPEMAVDERINDYMEKELIARASNDLDKEQVDFRNLLNEYHDGILLFEISNKEIWERASQDEAGLTTYFMSHRSDYAWQEPHYKGYVIYCKDKNTFQAAKAIAKYTTDSLETYLYQRLNDSIQYVKIEQGLYVLGDNPVVDQYVFKQGKYIAEDEYPYVFTKGTIQKELPDSYEDVRGAVTADYQEFLEQEWLQYIRSVHKVEINYVVLDELRKRL